MARVVVDVMLKPEILDPQGQAVASALPAARLRRRHRRPSGQALRARGRRRGHRGALAQVRETAETLLANPVIEDFTVRVEEPRR